MEMNNFIKNNGNIKLGMSMGTISKLMGNEPVYIESWGTTILGSCGSYCESCAGSCYVKKSYRYPSVRLSHARTTTAIRYDIHEYFKSIHTQLSRKRKHFDYVRINQSGEIERLSEFTGYLSVAFMHPETTFYMYTKNYGVLFTWLQLGFIIPSNMWVNVSIWGEYGIYEYKYLKTLSNQIGAFVCITEEYTIEFYASRGIIIESLCKAYNESGKLNHNVTCDKCKKCMQGKVVACFEH